MLQIKVTQTSLRPLIIIKLYINAHNNNTYIETFFFVKIYVKANNSASCYPLAMPVTTLAGIQTSKIKHTR